MTVAKFARIAGVTKGDLPLYENKLFPEEAKEFWTGVQEDDIIEQRDGLADMKFIADMIGLIGGNNGLYAANTHYCFMISPVPLDQFLSDFEAVVASNMTKFDHSFVDADRTRRYYEYELEVPTYNKQDEKTGLIATFSKTDKTGTDGEFYPKDKLLKSRIQYLPPQIK